MSKVHVLSPDIISKIAAGEVIERPASVIKELLENSLDAGATAIEVHLKEAGKTYIQVKDNGHGIDRDDLDKIFLRHATSKISSAEDLFSIQSLGFRGEALYSVAAIADIVLKTKTAESDSGWEIHLRGGTKLGLKPCAQNTNGTDIEIKELFFNTPARKKFLKTNSTEMHQILSIVIPYTLLYPQIRFRLSHQGKDLIDLHPTDNLLSRVAHILNLEEKFIFEAQKTFSEHHCAIRLVLGDINIKRVRRDLQFIFINGRPVQNKNISYHMNQIYRLIMPADQYPFFAVYLTVPAENVDVNIHPTKREVKIKNETIICNSLRLFCEESLLRNGPVKEVFIGGKKVTLDSQNVVSESLTQTFRRESDDLVSTVEIAEASASYVSSDDYAYPKSQTTQPEFFIPQDNILTQKQNTLQFKLENARYIGPFMQKFLLFESGASLLIIDQHAAAERITYEQLIRQMQKSTLEVQNLLAPILLKLTSQEMLIWEESQEILEKAGFSNTSWGADTIAIHSYPLLLKDTEKAVRYILAGERIEKSDFATLARRACRSSVMAGDILKKEQSEFMREQLLQCLDPFTCPHGRPTVLELSESFFDKQFLRC